MSVEQNEADKKVIEDFRESYVFWEPGGKSVTLDGTYDIEQLKILIRFMENGGPGEGNRRHDLL